MLDNSFNNQDELERILEKSIASYVEAEPLAGMEERVITRIGMTETPRRSVNSWHAVLALCLAGMVIAGFVLVRTKQSKPRPMATVAVSRPPHFEQAQTPVFEPRRRLHAARVRRVSTLPKGRVFPTPSPLTKEERLMVALVVKNPDETAQAFDGLRRRTDEPIAVAPIVIAPISLPISLSDEQ
jgi:hypothetical protein